MFSPRQRTILKAIKQGLLRGAPNLSEKLIKTYLPPAPATAKGHMKRPRHGIRSTTPKPPKDQEAQPDTPPVNDVTQPPPDMEITEDEANIFCFGVFADKTLEWCTMI